MDHIDLMPPTGAFGRTLVAVIGSANAIGEPLKIPSDWSNLQPPV